MKLKIKPTYLKRLICILKKNFSKTIAKNDEFTGKYQFIKVSNEYVN